MPGKPHSGYGKKALTHRITVRLPYHFVEFLNDTADKHGTNISKVVRAALEHYNPKLAARRSNEI